MSENMKMNKEFRSLESPIMGKNILKLSILSLSLMYLSVAKAAENEESPQTTKVAKVTVTGSSIKGVAAQSASPITIIKGDDLAKQGVTTVEEALTKVSSNQAGFSTSQNVGASNTEGSSANLRGLGTDKTLVLLNGRRLAYSPFSTSTTNLNIIPMAMVERIEILRDGASAVYGADAIGGVINFITKKSLEGLNISVGATQPEASGGDKQDISIFGGYGNLDEQGFNVYGVVDYRRTNNIMAKDRKISRRGGVIPELGLDASSANAFPANFFEPKSNILANPYGNTNCNNTPNVIADGGLCYLNTQALIGITPEVETISALGRGTFKLSDQFNLIGEYIFSRNEVTTSIAPDVYSRSVTLPSTSQYYPGKGITPEVSGLNDADLQLYLRSQGGNRSGKTTNDSHRAFAGIEGEAYGWDINAGLTYAKSEATDSFNAGYLNQSKVQAALNDGSLNPFGPSADANIWKSFEVNGDTNKASLDSTSVDVTVSRPIYSLPAGDVGFALGGSFTKQNWDQKINAEIVRQVPGSGIDPDKPVSKGDRDISAVFTELHIPILANLEAQLAARYDDYSDFGDTFNPKVALRWEPLKQLMFRTSYSTGFRAPSLYDINAPQSQTYTGSRYNDPVLCPGGVASSPQYQTECNVQFKRMQGGNPDLKAEESTSYTAGVVFEPIKNLVFTADYYNIKVDNLIDAITDSIVFADPNKYASLFVRDADGRIKYVSTTLINMGGIKTQGVDLSLNYLTPVTKTGRFGFGIDGTYVIKYDKQEEKGGEWIGRVGSYYNQQVYTRWKHVANVNWSYDNWKMIFEQQFSRGYKDSNTTGEAKYDQHRVSDYTLYNIAGTYSGFKNLELTAGIKNIFDQDPPASNVTDNFQYGYDSSYADPTGRAYYLRATYKF
jgi:iron complex outermembrane receptor protein